MNRTKINELKAILKKLDDKYNINTGGCIYVAYLIAKNLEKLGIHYEVIEWKDPDNDEVFHISIKINGIDVNPAYEELKGIPEKSKYQTSYKLMKLNAEYEDFNSIYKRQYKNIVREELQNFFNVKMFDDEISNIKEFMDINNELI